MRHTCVYKNVDGLLTTDIRWYLVVAVVSDVYNIHMSVSTIGPQAAAASIYYSISLFLARSHSSCVVSLVSRLSFSLYDLLSTACGDVGLARLNT